MQKDISKNDLKNIYDQNFQLIDFSVALNSGIFNLTVRDYYELPHTLIQSVLILKNEIIKKQNQIDGK